MQKKHVISRNLNEENKIGNILEIHIAIHYQNLLS